MNTPSTALKASCPATPVGSGEADWVETQLFRAQPATDASVVTLQRRDTLRPPGNVPYLVDNLWEWLRPPAYPSRRHAVYASPSARLALAAASASSGGFGQRNVAYRVWLPAGSRVACLNGYADAKFHPDIRLLPRLLFEHLGIEWAGLSVGAKQPLGQLFLPCLSASEVASILQGEPALAKKLAVEAGYWRDVSLRDPLE